MHPIHYSLFINALIIVVSAGLSLFMGNPLIMVIGFFMLQHMPARFGNDDDDEEGEEQPMGFTADVK